MIKCKNVVGTKPNIYIMTEEEATDIDTPLDFEVAEILYRKNHIPMCIRSL